MLAHIEDTDDVVALHAPERARLALEARQRVRIARRVEQELDGARLLDGRVRRPVDDAHPRRAEDPLDPELAGYEVSDLRGSITLGGSSGRSAHAWMLPGRHRWVSRRGRHVCARSSLSQRSELLRGRRYDDGVDRLHARPSGIRVAHGEVPAPYGDPERFGRE